MIRYFVLQFDRYLCALWDKAMSDGCFRYDLSEVKTRKLSGPHNYVALVSGMLHCHKQDCSNSVFPAQSATQQVVLVFFVFITRKLVIIVLGYH